MTTTDRPTTTEPFGGCPDCGNHDGYINIGQTHWFYCATHKTCWIAGHNLFSSWQHETEAEQRAAYEALNFGSFAYVACGEAEAKLHDAHHVGAPASNPTRVRTAPARQFSIGDQVIIPEAFGAGSGPWPGRISAVDRGQFCVTCHCAPPDPDHLGDGSLCCPGPWYAVVAPCADRCTTGEHVRIYAEHELRRAPSAGTTPQGVGVPAS